MAIDTSQIRDTEDIEVASAAPDEAPQGDAPVAAIQLFLNPDLTINFKVDEKQVKSLDAAIHCLSAALAALETDRQTLRTIQMQQQMALAAQQNAQVQAFARPPSYDMRGGRRRVH